MALPTTREATYTGTSAVPSGAFNIMQDCIIGRKKPLWWRQGLPLPFFLGSYTAPAAPTQFYLASAAGAVTAALVIPAELGDRAGAGGMHVDAFGNGALNVTYTLQWISAANAATTIGTVADNARAAAWGTVSIPGTTPHVMAAGECLVLSVTSPNAAGYRVGPWECSFDRL